MYGKINENNPTEDRSHVTVMFTIPETCPDELFPMKVYLSANELDIRYEAGMALPVVRNGDKEWYSSGDIKTEPDYKFLYTVEQAGVQRVYFENILSHSAFALLFNRPIIPRAVTLLPEPDSPTIPSISPFFT